MKLLFAMLLSLSTTTAALAKDVLSINASRNSTLMISSDKQQRTLSVSPGDKIVINIVEGDSDGSVSVPTAPVEKEECLSNYGITECGYGCIANYGKVKCGKKPGMKCAAAFGKVECGYDCKEAYGQIKCAQNPGGTCEAAYGKITCSK